MFTKSRIRKVTLLLSSMMTMMAGAVVAPSLPQINTIFSATPNADILTRLIITLPALFIAFFSPIFGKLSDRIGRKKILLIALCLYSISGASGYIFNNLYLILVGRAFLGIAVAGIMTMAIALVGDYYKAQERSQFMGIQGAFMGIGGVVFISLAGWLADFGWHVPFLIYLFGFLVLPLALIFLYEPEHFNNIKNTTKAPTIAIDYSKQLVTIIYAIMFFGIIAFYMIPVQIPYLLKGIAGVTNTQVGLAIAAQSLAGAIVAMNYRRIKQQFTFCSIYQIAFAFMAIGYLGIGLSESYSAYILGLIVSGLGIGLLMPTGNMWIIEVSPESIRGKLVGKANTAVFVAMFLSPILIQPIIKVSSLSGAFIFMGFALIAFIGILMYLKANQYKHTKTVYCEKNIRKTGS
jgi:MFS family permease